MLKWIISRFSPQPVFELAEPGAKLPTRGTKDSAGLDLYSSEGCTIGPGRTALVHTGLKCKFNRGWVAFIWDRSGMGFRGVHRFAGCIDSDYPGLWGVVLYNSTVTPVTIEEGDRVAQVVFQRVWLGPPKIGEVNQTGDREGGFGSTGK